MSRDTAPQRPVIRAFQTLPGLGQRQTTFEGSPVDAIRCSQSRVPAPLLDSSAVTLASRSSRSSRWPRRDAHRAGPLAHPAEAAGCAVAGAQAGAPAAGRRRGARGGAGVDVALSEVAGSVTGVEVADHPVQQLRRPAQVAGGARWLVLQHREVCGAPPRTLVVGERRRHPAGVAHRRGEGDGPDRLGRRSRRVVRGSRWFRIGTHPVRREGEWFGRNWACPRRSTPPSTPATASMPLPRDLFLRWGPDRG